VAWRAVERDPRLALTGTPASADADRWRRELAEVAALAGPGEQVPDAGPATISNTGAAVAAYAEAVTDGVADELRRSLFAEIWVRQQHLSSPHEVRRLVRALTTWPTWAPRCRAGGCGPPPVADHRPAGRLESRLPWRRLTRRNMGQLVPGLPPGRPC
jgi:hypothetical protein